MPLTISTNGINLIKRFEGCRLSAYRDAVGVVTIGYGWTKAIDGKPLTMGTKITQKKAEALLKEGLKSYEAKVNKYNSDYHWNQNQFDALVSFCYNIGNIDGLTAKGTRSIKEIANKFTAYNKAGGRVLSGLTKRRKEEKQLFLSAPAKAKDTHKNFVKEVQAVFGIKTDGIAGEKILAKTITVSAKENNTHAVVKPIQNYLNSIGYPCGTPDGIAGNKFSNAVKAFQKENNCIADGVITKKGKTWKKLLQIT